MTNLYDHPLPMTLEVSLPLKISAIQERGGPNNLDWARAKEFLNRCMDEPSFSEALLFKVKGKSAQAFNELTHAIAVMSFQPGGIEIFGRHWDGSKPVAVLRHQDEEVANEQR